MAAKLAHQRVRGRMNQRRYRKKQTQKISSLQQDLQLLREEIEMCKMRRSNRWDTITVKPTPWSVVVEYHRLFCRGVNPSLSATSCTQARPSLRMQYPIEFVHQLSFLQTVMMPRVVCNGKRISIEAHLEEWKTVSRIYPDFDMKLVHMKEGPSGEMVATSKATFTFTEDTLCNGFPHLVSNNNTNPIAASLMGQKLEIRTVTRFVWDDTMGRVAELSFQTDLIKLILSALGSLEQVASVFSHALVTPEGHIIAE
ncbi:hypothetical protein PHMEG_00028252 [Phytophthora megakarya]|uniref:Bzip transcription factor n=1 Tax=Phytophthora megakarya TaxID=4795 RepID=A0A225V5E4_9STRA|nr:hypothetical protein PHMEG_00028252 [Phytophthora megakarya]